MIGGVPQVVDLGQLIALSDKRDGYLKAGTAVNLVIGVDVAAMLVGDGPCESKTDTVLSVLAF